MSLNQYFSTPEKLELVDIPNQLTRLFGISMEEINNLLTLSPGIECYTNLTEIETPFLPFDVTLPLVSAEGFTETMKSIWETLKKWFQRIIAWFKSFTHETKLETAALRFKANNLKIHARNDLGKTITKSDSLVMNTHVAALSVLYDQPRDVSALIRWLSNLHRVMSIYYEYTDRIALKGLKEMVGVFQSIDPSTLTQDELERKIIQPVSRFTPEELTKRLGDVKQHTAVVYLGPQMLGNVRFRFELPEDRHSGLRKLNEYKITMAPAAMTPRTMSAQFSIPRFSLQNNDQLLDRVLSLCDLLDATVKVNEERERTVNALTKSIERFVDRTYSIQDGSAVIKQNAEQLVRLSRQLTQWVTPFPGVTGVALRAMRGVIILCEKNIK